MLSTAWEASGFLSPWVGVSREPKPTLKGGGLQQMPGGGACRFVLGGGGSLGTGRVLVICCPSWGYGEGLVSCLLGGATLWVGGS